MWKILLYQFAVFHVETVVFPHSLWHKEEVPRKGNGCRNAENLVTPEWFCPYPGTVSSVSSSTVAPAGSFTGHVPFVDYPTSLNTKHKMESSSDHNGDAVERCLINWQICQDFTRDCCYSVCGTSLLTGISWEGCWWKHSIIKIRAGTKLEE